MMIGLFTTWFLCMISVARADPKGHLEPLGSHMRPRRVEKHGEFPHPRDFFENYVKYGTPVLFKAVLEKGDYKPFTQWDDNYMREKFGKSLVDVEKGKKENREDGRQLMTFRRFLDTYSTGDIYLVEDLTRDMLDDVSIPYSVRCGGAERQLFKTILWMSGGGTKSVLHMDVFDNINCLLDGTKDFILFDQVYGESIESQGYKWEGSHSLVDVDRVDMYNFPQFRDMPYHAVTMEKGDCLFIPSRWYHQVNSHGSRNMAINLWFNHPFWYNATDCAHRVGWEEATPISQKGFANTEEHLRHMVLEALDFDDDSISLRDFLDFWYYISINTQASAQLFHHLDTDGDGELTWEELYTFNVHEAFTKHPYAFGNDFRQQYKEKRDMLKMLSGQNEEEAQSNIAKDEL